MIERTWDLSVLKRSNRALVTKDEEPKLQTQDLSVRDQTRFMVFVCLVHPKISKLITLRIENRHFTGHKDKNPLKRGRMLVSSLPFLTTIRHVMLRSHPDSQYEQRR